MSTGILHTAPRAAKRYLQRKATVLGSVTAVRDCGNRVVLTYDDGPEPGGTEAVLTALADHRATATFFVLLTRARKYPQLLQEVRSEGHEIALHGLDHQRLTGFGYREIQQRTADGRAELEDAIGRRVDWVRPPYGRQTLRSWRAVKTAGVLPVLWGPSSADNADVEQHERVRRATEGTSAGSILLGHDGFATLEDGVDDGPAPRIDRGELVTRVLDTLGENGLSGSSLTAALSTGQPVRTAWFKR